MMKKNANKITDTDKKLMIIQQQTQQQQEKRITMNDRRILIPRTNAIAQKANVINIRDSINHVLREHKAEKNIVVIAATYNEKGTIVCTTREDCTAAAILKYKEFIYKEIQKINNAVRTSQIHVEWSKVIVHNVSCERYTDDDKSMNNLQHEIQDMNSKMELVTVSR